MTLDEYQELARRTMNPALAGDERLLDAAAGLSEEAGELLGLVRKQVFQRRQSSTARFAEELGDVLWCLAITADSLGLSLAQIAAGNVRKLEERHPQGFRSADTR
jgi:NTP pyrophosphatase (non-canonical NTP hydrolase)